MSDEPAIKQRRSGFTAGLVVGGILFLLSMLLAGAGDGWIQPGVLSGSPFSVFGLGLLAIPMFWALAGWIAGSPHHHRNRRMAGLVLFALHYLVGGFIVIGPDNAEWISDARPGWSILALWFVPYVLAHVAFWIEFASKDGKWLRE